MSDAAYSRLGSELIATIPEGWSVTVIKGRDGSPTIVAAHSKCPPRCLDYWESPKPFDEWREILPAPNTDQ